ncbi:hypothetical protein HAP48_0037560 [Bradyrhizobium septentrionale]|uniref:Uncharacterized protein n=1 Tax=Bradyrhizobium septentrionale TaxID=1404411 RepID=A0A973W101_9BRAD|nr:hypothetical protein [Bradyrhizobium septentrionale]UGY14225.1 hypothetical protein HAP48_0037560 [Bradyrhizobium septentrionale]
MQRGDQGFGAAGLLVLASLLVYLIVIALPIIKADTVRLSDWLCFYGAVVSGSMTLVGAGAAWFAVRRQINEQRKLADERADKERASLSASIYAEIADRAARCLNDYIRPWSVWEDRQIEPTVRAFLPERAVVYPGAVEKLGLLDQPVVVGAVQFYSRLSAVAQAMEFIAADKERLWETVQKSPATAQWIDPLRNTHARLITERLQSCFQPALAALKGLGERPSVDADTVKVYPYLRETGLTLHQALEKYKMELIE